MNHQKIKWTEVDPQDLSAWAAVLDRMLDEAQDPDSLAVAEAIVDDLDVFIAKSPALLEGTKELDDAARKAKGPLRDAIIAGALTSLEQRASELVSLQKEIARARGDVEKKAADLRLTSAHMAVDALTEAARAVEDFDATLKDGTDDDLRKQLKDALKALDGLKKLVEKKKTG